MRGSLFLGALCALLAPANAQFAADLSDRAALDALAQAEAEQVDVMLQLNRGYVVYFIILLYIYFPPLSLSSFFFFFFSFFVPFFFWFCEP
jgi:hypothetical protein